MARKICKHDGPKYPCDRFVEVDGYCQMHYMRKRKGSVMDAPVQKKKGVKRKKKKTFKPKSVKERIVNVSEYNVETGELDLIVQYKGGVGYAMEQYMKDYSDPKTLKLDRFTVRAKDYPNWEHLCFWYPDTTSDHESLTKVIVKRKRPDV